RSPQKLFLAVEEIKTESDAVDGMEVSMPPKAEQALTAQKRKAPSPPHSSNGHSPSETSPSPTKKKKKPGLVNNKDQCELRHGPFYYVKQPALTTDPVDVVPQDGRNDFYCWVCHREGQVLCCELCPRVYHAKCLKLAAEPEGDWFCPECEKITVAECIETQSKAMTMLNLEQLSYLLKFALQKMKQPGTEPFQKPVSLEQHPDYVLYVFILKSIIKKTKKMYGCTEAFLADMKWILHNCIIYNGGNHKLTATAKVIVKICEHEMNEIEVCPECYLSACQKRDNWFCEPCSQPHPLVWAKLKGFPFWPAKALRDKDGQVDARFFGQHDRAWVPINNCYLMSKEIPFSVKKTKSIFNSAMQEMEVYVENVRKKYSVFHYAPFRTPYTPNNQFQMLQDPNNPKKGTVKPEKQDKVKFSFDMTASPKMLLSKTVMSGGPGRRISVTDAPRSPTSTNSSVHTGSDLEQDERGARVSSSHYSGGEDSMDYTASPASLKTSNSPKPLLPTPVKQERSSGTGGILNLNLDRIKAEMDLKELSETVQQQQQQQQQQGTSVLLTSPKKPTRSLDKTIESCKAQLGINEISDNVFHGVEHSDSDDSDKSDSSDSEYMSEDEQKPKNTNHNNSAHKDSKKRARPPSAQAQEQDAAPSTAGGTPGGDKKSSDPQTKEKLSSGVEKDSQEKSKPLQQTQKERSQSGQDARPAGSELDVDSDSERELVIDLGEEPGGREKKKAKRETPSAPISTTKDQTGIKTDGKTSASTSTPASSSTDNTSSSINPGPKDAAESAIKPPATVTTASTTQATSTSAVQPMSAVPVASNVGKKQRPLLPKENTQPAQRPATLNPAGGKFQTSSQKVQRQQQQQGETAPQSQAQPQTSANNSSTRYQTRQSVKAVQHKDTSPVNMGSGASTSSLAGDFLTPPASADVAADIAKYTTKVSQIFTSDVKTGQSNYSIRRLRIEIEKLQWLHQQELSEMKHNLELTMAEMRQSLEQERERLVSEVKKQMEMEKQQAVDETKKKQWCANCKKEAIFYCCWNTSYCDYPCQQAHWPEHMKSCTQSATATQQEAETEASSDAAGKPVGQSPKTQPSPTGERTSPPNRGPSPFTDNNKGSSSMAVS
uniref:Protein kinase C-binding protein 1-like n=1 Tax=Sinocyclocheilus rhinocerous TaxID=307959 RepID=A0A673IHY0_9TELE